MTFTPARSFRIANSTVGAGQPTYFIADIAANHDGDLSRAIRLIELAAKAGADAAKFQHFAAKTIVSDHGFKGLDHLASHQSAWTKSVFEVYHAAAVDPGWTPALRQACDRCGIAFFTSPYSFELVDAVDPYVSAYKVGSGDITWPAIIERMAHKGKPVLIASGASTMDDVQRAMATALALTGDICLMQCNTNYTGSLENLRYVQLNVLKTYAVCWPDLVLGLSDHTPGHASVLGAVALNARIIEKHFTDDRTRPGPDHGFAMDPCGWREMVDRTRELEAALGTGLKRIEDNELQTAVLQRRSLRAYRDLPVGHVLSESDLFPLRPCPADGLPPFMLQQVLGRSLVQPLANESHLTWQHFR